MRFTQHGHILEPTKDKVLIEFDKLKGKSENIVSAKLRTITGVPFYNLSTKIFDNADFGFNKITVERPLRLNFQACAQRISLLDNIRGFKKIAESNKKKEIIHQQEIEVGTKSGCRFRHATGF